MHNIILKNVDIVERKQGQLCSTYILHVYSYTLMTRLISEVTYVQNHTLSICVDL